MPRKNNKQKNKKRSKIKKETYHQVSVIELLLTLFLGTSGSLSGQSSHMNSILKKGRLQKKFSSRKCLHLKKVLSIKVTLSTIRNSAHSMKLYLAMESVLLFLFKSLANRSIHLEVFREIGVPKFEIKIHEKYL